MGNVEIIEISGEDGDNNEQGQLEASGVFEQYSDSEALELIEFRLSEIEFALSSLGVTAI